MGVGSSDAPDSPEAPGPVEALRFLALPVATLAIVNLAAYARHAMTATRSVLREPYIQTARMKGLPERAVVWRHAFPNAAVPVLTVDGVPQQEQVIALVDTGMTHQVELRLPARLAIPEEERL